MRVNDWIRNATHAERSLMLRNLRRHGYGERRPRHTIVVGPRSSVTTTLDGYMRVGVHLDNHNDRHARIDVYCEPYFFAKEELEGML